MPSSSAAMERNDVPETAVSREFTILTVGDLRLLIPKEQVQVLESIRDINTEEISHKDQAIGSLKYQGETLPVFCLTDDLTLTNVVPPERRVGIVVKANNTFTFNCILCDQASLLDGSQFQPYPVPDCMSTENSPVHSLAILHDAEIACIVSSDSLMDFIQPANNKSLANSV